MSLWTPYQEERALDLTKPVRPESFNNQEETFQQTLHLPLNLQCPSYHYVGYDPVRISPVETTTCTSISPDSGCSSGTISPQRINISRPFKHMTSSKSARSTFYNNVTHTSGTSNPRMRRQVVGTLEAKETDLEYIERRKKNNEAAKRSREMRKIKEDQLALNLTFLEEENQRLNMELRLAKERLHMLVTSHNFI